LQLLHRARFEMVMAERTIQVVFLQHDDFSFVIAQSMGLSVYVPGGEIRRAKENGMATPTINMKAG